MYKKITILLIIISIIFFTQKHIKLSFAAQETIEGKHIEDETVDSAIKAVAQENQNWECLNIVDPVHSKNVEKVEKIQLKGQCSSSNGCVAVICQGSNGAFKSEHRERLKNMEEKGLNAIRSAKKRAELAANPAYWKNELNRQKRSAGAAKINSLCTTGNASLDIAYFGKDNTNKSLKFSILGFIQDIVNKAKGLIDNVLGDSTTTNNLNYGQVDIEAELAGAGNEVTYAAYAVSKGELASGTEDTEVVEGEAKTQQQAQLESSFSFATDVEGAKQKCTRIYWDPFGRVFDSESLEPVPDAVVSILDEDKIPLPEDEVPTNNYMVGSNGLYNIMISQSGNYYLSVEPYTDHEFVSDVKLHPSYSKMYYDLYYPNTKFYEKTGELTHHDIPLKPIGEPFKTTPVVYPESLEQKKLRGFRQFNGQNSHPLATVCLKGEITGKNYACAKAEKYGFFQILINDADYPSEVLIPTATKADLNNPEAINQPVQKLSTITPTPDPFIYVDLTKVKYQPILKHIEGYIYDDQGKVIPQAEVRVMLSMTESIYYTAIADDSGFVTIYEKNLPSLDYYLEIIDPKTSKSRVITTSEYIKENKSYIDTEKINLGQGTKNNQPIINPVTGTLNEKAINTDSSSTNNLNKNNSTINNTNQQTNYGTIVLAVFIILVLVALVVGVLIYIKNNNHSFKP